MSDFTMTRLVLDCVGLGHLVNIDSATFHNQQSKRNLILTLPDELLFRIYALACSDGGGNLRRGSSPRNADFAAIRLSCKRMAAVGLDSMIEYAKIDASHSGGGLSIKYDMTEKSLAQIELVAGHPRLSELVETIFCIGYELQATENHAEGSTTGNPSLPRRIRPLTYRNQAEKRLRGALTKFPILHRIVYERRRTQHHDIPLLAPSINTKHNTVCHAEDTLTYHAWLGLTEIFTCVIKNGTCGKFDVLELHHVVPDLATCTMVEQLYVDLFLASTRLETFHVGFEALEVPEARDANIQVTGLGGDQVSKEMKAWWGIFRGLKSVRQLSVVGFEGNANPVNRNAIVECLLRARPFTNLSSFRLENSSPPSSLLLGLLSLVEGTLESLELRRCHIFVPVRHHVNPTTGQQTLQAHYGDWMIFGPILLRMKQQGTLKNVALNFAKDFPPWDDGESYKLLLEHLAVEETQI